MSRQRSNRDMMETKLTLTVFTHRHKPGNGKQEVGSEGVFGDEGRDNNENKKHEQ